MIDKKDGWRKKEGERGRRGRRGQGGGWRSLRLVSVFHVTRLAIRRGDNQPGTTWHQRSLCSKQLFQDENAYIWRYNACICMFTRFRVPYHVTVTHVHGVAFRNYWCYYCCKTFVFKYVVSLQFIFNIWKVFAHNNFPSYSVILFYFHNFSIIVWNKRVTCPSNVDHDHSKE